MKLKAIKGKYVALWGWKLVLECNYWGEFNGSLNSFKLNFDDTSDSSVISALWAPKIWKLVYVTWVVLTLPGCDRPSWCPPSRPPHSQGRRSRAEGGRTARRWSSAVDPPRKLGRAHWSRSPFPFCKWWRHGVHSLWSRLRRRPWRPRRPHRRPMMRWLRRWRGLGLGGDGFRQRCSLRRSFALARTQWWWLLFCLHRTPLSTSSSYATAAAAAPFRRSYFPTQQRCVVCTISFVVLWLFRSFILRNVFCNFFSAHTHSTTHTHTYRDRHRHFYFLRSSLNPLHRCELRSTETPLAALSFAHTYTRTHRKKIYYLCGLFYLTHACVFAPYFIFALRIFVPLVGLFSVLILVAQTSDNIECIAVTASRCIAGVLSHWRTDYDWAIGRADQLAVNR